MLSISATDTRMFSALRYRWGQSSLVRQTKGVGMTVILLDIFICFGCIGIAVNAARNTTLEGQQRVPRRTFTGGDPFLQRDWSFRGRATFG